MTDEAEAVETGPEDAPEIEAPEVEVELDDDGTPIEADEDEDAEEYEHNGKTYKVPKDLKAGYLRTQDYTQKTMELAEVRKATEAREAAIAQREAFNQTHAAEIAQLGAAQHQVQEWSQWIADNPDAATPADYHKLQTLKEAAARTYQGLQEKHQTATAEAQRADATALTAMRDVLTKDLPGYSPETEAKIFSFATADLGYRPEEVAAVRDPRIVKTLHLAMLGKQATAKQSAAKTVQAQQATAPVVGVAGARASTGSSWMTDPRTTPEEFARRRNEEQAKKGRR